MKVYIVTYIDPTYDERDIHGVYASMEKAHAYVVERSKNDFEREMKGMRDAIAADDKLHAIVDGCAAMNELPPRTINFLSDYVRKAYERDISRLNVDKWADDRSHFIITEHEVIFE